jgi:hypothetical protein
MRNEPLDRRRCLATGFAPRVTPPRPFGAGLLTPPLVRPKVSRAFGDLRSQSVWQWIIKSVILHRPPRSGAPNSEGVPQRSPGLLRNPG